MADLLECLIQIKALRDTLERTASRVPGSPAGPEHALAWTRMAAAERRYAAALGAAAAGYASCPGRGPDEARSEFVALRQANLAALERCTAGGLATGVTWAGRSATTVADLVAIMLAHDTEVLGVVRSPRAGHAVAAAHACSRPEPQPDPRCRPSARRRRTR